jgi:hypothetical protein
MYCFFNPIATSVGYLRLFPRDIGLCIAGSSGCRMSRTSMMNVVSSSVPNAPTSATKQDLLAP